MTHSADVRGAAVALRLSGHTYDEIRAQLGVSKGTLSIWLRNLFLPPDVREHLLKQRSDRRFVPRGGGGAARRRQAIDADEAARTAGTAWLGQMSSRELVIAASVAYWCEGAKSKPWDARRQVTFMNSDPGLVHVFIAGMLALGVTRDRLSFRLHIHEQADVDAALRIWSEVVDVPADAFLKTTLKRHVAVTNRRNVDSEYIGCLVVRVARGSDVYRRIDGLVAAIVTRATDTMSPPRWGVV